MRIWLVTAALAWAPMSCSKPNPNRCCVDPTDCAANHIPNGSTCADGLVCRGNQCIAEVCTSTAECDPAAPYCTSGGMCGSSCGDNSQCPGFGQDANQKVCSNGTCVECAAASDCPADRPVCDHNACRACTLDSDCPSGACGASGACVDESSIVYVDAANGLDAGTCTRQMPCQSLQFAVSTTNATRSHIVMAPGTYVGTTTISSMSTTAPQLEIHGGGATLQPPVGGDVPTLEAYDVATTVHDLDFVGNSAFNSSIQTGPAPCTAYRVKIENAGGILGGDNLTMHDVQITSPTGDAIQLGRHTSLDRIVIEGGTHGLYASGLSGAIVDATNVLVYGTSGSGVELSNITGTIAFTTVADTGISGNTPRAFNCVAGLAVSDVIVWTPGGTPIGGGCTLNTLIAGPTAVAGTQNVDPMFKDEAHRDYHIQASSPAKDLVDTGPATDFEGDPRPQGVRYDIGADEAPP